MSSSAYDSSVKMIMCGTDGYRCVVLLQFECDII